MFINLPTGFRKSLIYQALPLVCDTVRGTSGHIVVVVSPLVNLMKDQVGKLVNIGDLFSREMIRTRCLSRYIKARDWLIATQ